MSLEIPLVLAVHENRIKWLPLSVLQPGRVEALSSGQDSLKSAQGWGGAQRGKGLQCCYLRASRWVQTWEKTLSTEPSALTCRETAGRAETLGRGPVGCTGVGAHFPPAAWPGSLSPASGDSSPSRNQWGNQGPEWRAGPRSQGFWSSPANLQIHGATRGPQGAHLADDATFLIEGDDGFRGLVIGF